VNTVMNLSSSIKSGEFFDYLNILLASQEWLSSVELF
jgi:hypothetical protein